MTQWLIEEASFLAVDVEDAQEVSGQAQERREAEQLMARHAELTALKEGMR